MCGLFGWMTTGRPEDTRYDLLPMLTKAMAIISEERGKDSVGIAFMAQGATAPTVLKAMGPAHVGLRAMAEGLQAAYQPGTLWLMGHTRSATIGAVDTDNAHPFLMGNTLGAHNGHITNYQTLDVDAKRYKLPGCDSAALIARIDQAGAKEAISEAFGTIHLSFSQAPWHTVTIYKEYDIGLALAYIPSWGLILWASEATTLHTAVALCDGALDGQKDHIVIMPKEALCVLSAKSIGAKDLVWPDPTPAPAKVWTPTPYCWHPRQLGFDETSRRGKRPRGPAHRSAFADEFWHHGTLDNCIYCKDHEQTQMRWIFYRRRAPLIAVTTQGVAWGRPVRCFNCNQYQTLAWFREGYHCTRCGAWMTRMERENTPLPTCPTDLPARTNGHVTELIGFGGD